MRVWYNGNTLAFQANDAGSIPATRSIYTPSQRLSNNHHDSQLLSLFVIFFLVQLKGFLYAHIAQR